MVKSAYETIITSEKKNFERSRIRQYIINLKNIDIRDGHFTFIDRNVKPKRLLKSLTTHNHRIGTHLPAIVIAYLKLQSTQIARTPADQITRGRGV